MNYLGMFSGLILGAYVGILIFLVTKDKSWKDTLLWSIAWICLVAFFCKTNNLN